MRQKVFPYIVLIAALSLACSAAYYSVFGISKLFSAQAVAVAIMAGTLEASKLIAATYLHRYWKQINVLLKTYLTIAVCILMFITSLGIYGFLVSAYQTTSNELSIIEKQISIIELKKERFNEQLTSYSSEKSQLSNSITELTKGLSNNKIQYRDKETNQIITTTSSSTRKVLTAQLNDMKDQRNIVSKKIESFSDSITKLDLQILDIESNSEAATEVGPLKYVSELLEKPMNEVVNWFILIFIFVFDPFAIVLLISANKAFDILRESVKENIYGEKLIVNDDWDEAEKRMDIIGQNGNDGLHYEKSNQQKTGKTIIKS
tara:strand:+ start:984 stop:1940 length:957 start_codon:yes stop_codon:yes gene_type:complete